jgi:hypothetical protein
MSWSGLDVSDKTWQAVEKSTSAALHSLFVIAAYEKYASFLTISRALHLCVFEQPE